MFGYKAPAGVLTVELVEARNLAKEDFGGHNDTFVELWFDEDYKQRSEVVENTENPVYNQTFTFNINEGDKGHRIYLKVMDKDNLDTDKVGEGELDVKIAFEGEPIDTWVKLPGKLHIVSKGEVHLRVQFTPQ